MVLFSLICYCGFLYLFLPIYFIIRIPSSHNDALNHFSIFFVVNFSIKNKHFIMYAFIRKYIFILYFFQFNHIIENPKDINSSLIALIHPKQRIVIIKESLTSLKSLKFEKYEPISLLQAKGTAYCRFNFLHDVGRDKIGVFKLDTGCGR